MDSPRPFIEVLIPTYRRPTSAIRAIRSVLDAEHPDASVFCQSNGLESDIAAFARENPRCIYRYFETNQGAVVNFRELIRRSRAEYVIFLSDEDKLNSEYIREFVEHLRHHQPVFTFCSINDEHGRPYFALDGLQVDHLTSAQVALLFPIDPTYISGYCYRRSAVTDELLDTCFEDHLANAYPHLLLRNALLTAGKISVFARPLIDKGEEAQTGGDSHGHLASEESKVVKHSLNPRLYGVQARTRQFIYLQDRLRNSLAFLSGFPRAFSQLYLLAAWSRITNTANAVTNENFSFSSYAAACEEIAGAHQSLTCVESTFLRLITIRPRLLRKALIQVLWMVAKGGKLGLLLWHFGPARATGFLATRRG